MAQTIQIKRSSSTATPTSLSAGELAYSDSSDKLFIGQPSNNTVVSIGGKYYTDIIDARTLNSVSPNSTTNTASRTYKIQKDSNNHSVVNVPWADTNTVYSLPLASTSTRGGVKLFNDTDVTESGVNAVSTTAGRYYGVQLTQNNKMVVNVPWSGGSLSTTLGVGNTTGGNNIVFGDSSGTTDDRLVFGSANDLQIYHNGADSVIEDSGTGNLKLICQDLEVIDQSDNKLFSSNSSAETIFFAAGSDDALKIKNAAVEVIARPLKVDDIQEYTSGHGVEIDGVTLKDGGITATGDLVLGGDLKITGDINQQNVSVTDLDVTDKTITVGVGQTSAQAGASGLEVDRTDGTNPKFLYNGTQFEIDDGDGNLHGVIHEGNSATQTYTINGGTF